MPKVSGGDQFLSSAGQRVLQKSITYAKELGDQYVSLEHLLLALFNTGDQVSQLMKDAGYVFRKQVIPNLVESRMDEIRKELTDSLLNE